MDKARRVQAVATEAWWRRLRAVESRTMGGTMLDRQGRNELEGVLSLGRLADRMVFALGRVIRSEPLHADDAPALEHARQLFELMTKEEVIVLDSADDRMLNDDSYLDALHVVELRAEGAEVEQYAQHNVDLLRRVVDGQITDEERVELAAVRELFAEVGETTLSHANELSRPRQEPSWRRMRQAISHF